VLRVELVLGVAVVVLCVLVFGVAVAVLRVTLVLGAATVDLRVAVVPVALRVILLFGVVLGAATLLFGKLLTTRLLTVEEVRLWALNAESLYGLLPSYMPKSYAPKP